jgi:hypothetical protein
MTEETTFTGLAGKATFTLANSCSSLVGGAVGAGLSVWQAIELHDAGVSAIEHTLGANRVVADVIYFAAASTLGSAVAGVTGTAACLFCCPPATVLACGAGVGTGCATGELRPERNGYTQV